MRNVKGLEQLEAWKSFTDAFWRAPPAGTPADKFEFAFRRGFKRDKWTLYELSRNDPEGYVSDFQRRLMPRANTVYSRVLENRILLLQAASQSFVTPEIFAMRDENVGEVVFSDRWAAAMDGSSKEALLTHVQPLNSSVRGKSAVFRIEGGRYEGAGRTGSLEGLRGIVRDWARAAGCPYLLKESVDQGGYTRGMAPDAHNTLHLIICREHATWRPHLVAAVLRLGTRASGGSGKVEAGGGSFWIEPGSGQVSAGVALRKGKPQHVENHPDRDIPVVGTTVPHWESLLSNAMQFFDQSNYLRVAGFDFILGEDGPVLVGGANTPDLASAQVHTPLMTDPVFAEFLRREKI